jgi:prepilin-type N-terminal cleavage/methylation domain-containing protein
MTSARRVLGFTMVELMITLTVVLVIAMIAVPSFISFRQRSALRAGAEQAQSFWNQARLEAAKRNSLVKVGVFVSGTSYCLGAKTTVIGASDNDEPCDCTTTGATDSCDVARFPEDQAQWQGVTIVGTPTLGSDTGVAVIESRRTALTDPAMEGTITFAAPEGPNSYALNLYVDRQGRAVLCQSNAAADKMSDYLHRNCDP